MATNSNKRDWLDVLRCYSDADQHCLIVDAEAGDQDAQVLLAQRIIEELPGTEKLSPSYAIELLEKACSTGSARAQLLLGRSYWLGLDVQPDKEKAFSLISSSVAQGYVHAFEALAALYFEGIGCEANFSQACHLVAVALAWEGEVNFHENIRLGGNALVLYEYDLSVEGKLNNVSFSFADTELYALNKWLLQNKKVFLQKQIELNSKDTPPPSPTRQKLSSPYYGPSGMGWNYALAGEGSVSRIGFKDFYVESEFWVELNDLGWPTAKFPEFTELDEIVLNRYATAGQEQIDKIKWTLPSVQVPSVVSRLCYYIGKLSYGKRYKRPAWRRINNGTTEILFIGDLYFSVWKIAHCDGQYVNERLLSYCQD